MFSRKQKQNLWTEEENLYRDYEDGEYLTGYKVIEGDAYLLRRVAIC